MPVRMLSTVLILLVLSLTARASGPGRQLQPRGADLEREFAQRVKPFLDGYCVSCHGGRAPAAQLDLRKYASLADVIADFEHWMLLREKLTSAQMPPAQSKQPPAEARQQVADWIAALRLQEARRSAGDPGIVLARRLSNAEYNNTIRDLTGVDLRPAREFPVDPANPLGFDNSGESLSMSPALFTKYLQAAREVASNVVLKPGGIAFAPHPMLVETDRDKYCVSQIIAFYQRYSVDYADYFEALAPGVKGPPSRPEAASARSRRSSRGSLARAKADATGAPRLSAKYLDTIRRVLYGPREDAGPIAKLQQMWRELETDNVRAGAEAMRDYVVELRNKVAFKYTPIKIKGISETAQPLLMWRNKQYAANRRSFNRAALRVEGETTAAAGAADADLQVPPGQRDRYEAAFARFASVFPDTFFVSERGRYFPDTTRDKGRHLSAGFHNVMGYFRDDQPFYELMLDAREQRALDGMWDELDFVAQGHTRTFVQFFLNESGEARGVRKEAEGPRPADKDIASEAVVNEVAEAYRNRVRGGNDSIALKAIDEHFAWVAARLRWVDQARLAAEPRHVDALLDFAARAYRRALSATEQADLRAFYRSLRDKTRLSHDDAMRDALVSVLMSPDFCYRLDLVAAAKPGDAPLSDYALASRLSYFLWASMPDAELLARAKAGDLDRPGVLVAEARRMLKDPRVRGLATEFGGNWLDFRRFEEHNAVDRERFPVFTNELRHAMFEEPVRFMLDVFGADRSVLDFLYGSHTFVNPVLAKHYGVPEIGGGPDTWVRVENATEYGRGGLLPMAAFLTKNAPGLRTSPVKRGYWVVKQVLGEHIPPPPAAVPELPRDEAKMDLPLRDMLAQHRSNKMCASCHARFDSLGLVFEGYGPVGERRAKDLSGRPIDASATFPSGTAGSGIEGLRSYVREHRQNDFVDNLARKLLVYALGRSLILSDDLLIDAMRANLARDGYRFSSLVESIVTSRQFRNKRTQSATDSLR